MNSFESYYVYISHSVNRVWNNKGLSKTKEVVIYDGIREELYTPLTNKRNSKLRMIFLGGYAKSKGQEQLIDALSTIPENLKNKFEVYFYGNGDRKYINFLQMKINQNGLSDSMKLNPYKDDVWKSVPDFDIGLTCSSNEGFGRITVEYMMSGLCPIASNGGATPEIVKHGETGILYEVLNIEELKNSILWALENRDAIAKMGLEAARYANNHFTMREHAQNISVLYNQILKEKKNG